MVQNTSDIRYLLLNVDYDNLPEVSLDDLFEAWAEIHKGWSEIAGGDKADLALLKQKRLYALKYKLQYHRILYNAVSTLPTDDLIKQFEAEGYKVDKDKLNESLKVARGKILRKHAQLELEDKKKDDGKKTDFDAVIVLLQKHQGYAFNQKEMTVRELANTYKTFKDGQRRESKKR